MKALCSHGKHAAGYRHNCLVGYRRRIRDLWRKTYWVFCIYCDEMQGPHRERHDARYAADALNGDGLQRISQLADADQGDGQ